MSTLAEKAREPGPKRILSLDGGGIRGCLTIGYLEQIEALLRKQCDRPDLVLSDYFDLIGGTSTGALIAAQLALGREVAEIRQSYLEFGPNVFSKPSLWSRMPIVGKKLYTRWSVKPLEREIRNQLSDKLTLGSSQIKTGLCVVTKRADTFSTWPLINHPQGTFYKENGDIPLWKVLRASSAAPTFFMPIELDIGTVDEQANGIFVDGGVSMANNPAMQLFLVATLKGFPYHWETGKDRLMVVSIGTGLWRRKLPRHELLNPNNVYWAKTVPEMLMSDAGEQVELMMQYLSQSATARSIDMEVGTLVDDCLGGEPACCYVRYNAELETADDYRKHHRDKADQQVVNILSKYRSSQIKALREMDAGDNAEQLLSLGTEFAKVEVRSNHFPEAFAKYG